MRTDDNVDYDELHSVAPDPAQIDQYNAKINGLKENIIHFRDLEQRETDPDKKNSVQILKRIMYTQEITNGSKSRN